MEIRHAVDRDFAHFPTQHVQRLLPQIDDAPAIDPHNGTTLGSCFANMSSLQISGIHNMRVFMEDLTHVNVAQSPVVVALVPEIVDAARGVWIVPGLSLHCRMQETDVEITWNRIRI